MKQRVARSVALVAFATVLAACTGDGDGPNRAEDEVEYAIGEGNEYVALGDSYTAAPQTGMGDAPDGCYRSLINYPHQVAEATGVELIDNSCSGATTRALLEPQTTPLDVTHPPQLTGVDEDTDLITFGLGGNDFGLFARIVSCARFYGDASGSPCTDLDRQDGPNGITTRLEQLRTNVLDALQKVQQAGPNARIIVIGYPQLIPAQGTCELLRLPEGDLGYARTIVEGLNTALESAADQLDLTFVDVAAASEGHDVCSDEPWVAGHRAAFSGASPWHPYGWEAEAVTRLVLNELE